MVVLEDPKWDLGPLGRVVLNIIQKDWDLRFLLTDWGLMILPYVVYEKILLGVVPRTIVGFQ
jgi:hypothetical protein